MSRLIDHPLRRVIIKAVGPSPVKVNRGEHVKTWFPLAESSLKRIGEGEAENNLTEFNPLCLQSTKKKRSVMCNYVCLIATRFGQTSTIFCLILTIK
jgi:hypothetical protein